MDQTPPSPRTLKSRDYYYHKYIKEANIEHSLQAYELFAAGWRACRRRFTGGKRRD